MGCSDMPSSSNGSSSSSGAPAQPIQVPFLLRITGAMALTRPPGLRRQCGVPSAPTVLSTGSRLATTTNSLPRDTCDPPRYELSAITHAQKRSLVTSCHFDGKARRSAKAGVRPAGGQRAGLDRAIFLSRQVTDVYCPVTSRQESDLDHSTRRGRPRPFKAPALRRGRRKAPAFRPSVNPGQVPFDLESPPALCGGPPGTPGAASLDGVLRRRPPGRP